MDVGDRANVVGFRILHQFVVHKLIQTDGAVGRSFVFTPQSLVRQNKKAPNSTERHQRVNQKGRNGLQRIATTGERRYRSAKRKSKPIFFIFVPHRAA